MPISSMYHLSFSRTATKGSFADKTQDPHFRQVETVFSQDDLVRRNAAGEKRRNPLGIPIYTRIAG